MGVKTNVSLMRDSDPRKHTCEIGLGLRNEGLSSKSGHFCIVVGLLWVGCLQCNVS